MTNEEKALSIARLKKISESDKYENPFKLEIYERCLEMAQWKEQQMIKYLYKNIQSLLKDYGVSEASADIVTKLFLVNFKQSMKEE